MAEPVWFWQRIVSPHMAGLAAALAARGCDVTYVAEQEMSDKRASQGWQALSLGKARIRFAPDSAAMRGLAREAPADSIHICQGFRGNGPIGAARKVLAGRKLRQWVVMEGVDDSGWRGIAKRLEYRRMIRQWRPRLDGVLATGQGTAEWLVRRGMPPERVFPFAYFLPTAPAATPYCNPGAPFRFLYAGQIIERKRVDLLIGALERVKERPFELAIIGTGPLEDRLKAQAESYLPGRVHWLGRRPMNEIPALMATADCLILPSRHDGWGAVVSEALMAGTPAICSDKCGSAIAVRASGCGGVFPSGNRMALAGLLRRSLERGRQTAAARTELAQWAQCLGADAGAEYLARILRHRAGEERPVAPWDVRRSGFLA